MYVWVHAGIHEWVSVWWLYEYVFCMKESSLILNIGLQWMYGIKSWSEVTLMKSLAHFLALSWKVLLSIVPFPQVVLRATIKVLNSSHRSCKSTTDKPLLWDLLLQACGPHSAAFFLFLSDCAWIMSAWNKIYISLERFCLSIFKNLVCNLNGLYTMSKVL